MDVVSLQKEYDEINVRLSGLYEEADSIMTEKKDVSLLKKTLNELKDAHLSMQHLSVKAIGIADTDERAFLLTSIGNHISRKVVFDENVKKWLGQRDVSQEEIASNTYVFTLSYFTFTKPAIRTKLYIQCTKSSSCRETRGGAVKTCSSKTTAGVGRTRN